MKGRHLPSESVSTVENIDMPRGDHWLSNKLLRRALTLAVLLCGMAGSIFAGWQVKQLTEAEASAQFEGLCDEIQIRIRARLNAHAVLLRGAKSLLATSAGVSRDDWHAYIATMRTEELVPGYQAVGFGPFIPGSRLGEHIAAVRSEELSEYRVTPDGERDSYAPIVYIEPLAGRNPRSLGFDLLSEPIRRRALERARDTGDLTLTDRLTLSSEDEIDAQPGALIYSPVYRAGAPTRTVGEKRDALKGWVFGAYRIGDLMSGTLPRHLTGSGETIGIRVYDGAKATPEKLLFTNNEGGTPQGNGAALLHAERTVDFGGHSWLLVFDGTPALTGLRYSSVWFTTLSGLVITGLLFGMILLYYKRFDAQRVAEGLAGRIRNMAFHDSLTNLPNRLLLRDRMEMALAASKRSGCHGAVMMVDLDNFKPLNDECGHAAGDLLLIEVAKRLRGGVRETDTVARIGGDEFVVLLANLTGGEEAAQREANAVAGKILAALARPYFLQPAAHGEQAIEHRCSSSIGITLFSEHETDQHRIIKRADTAMYEAKRTGRNRTRFDSSKGAAVN